MIEMNFRHKKEFLRNEKIYTKSSKCKELAIIKRGTISTKKNIIKNTFSQNELIGLQYLFSTKGTYIYDYIAQSLTTIESITKDELLNDLDELQSFLTTLSDYTIKLELHRDILLLPTPLKKISLYLYQEYLTQESTTFYIKFLKRDLSIYLNIPPRILSKELLYLQNNNIISYQNKLYTIIDIDKLIKIIEK